jgi:hypothetical protein
MGSAKDKFRDFAIAFWKTLRERSLLCSFHFWLLGFSMTGNTCLYSPGNS